ncbi:hypothetical protein WICMUC_000996 [Wickerhamomyces mucosus]|uniref:SWIRM domain-containing protein n=1 Tax=Wickerhamomyces mucosus TaxID=1378264 RepID=A0A9P8PW66_9ASCO|nr:hypothetical protein WICMUC_000996 [Wickerhamomyces mucosus]
MSTSEFRFSAMTPEIGSSSVEFTSSEEQNYQLPRKHSKSSIDLSIPSPPLSPYQSSSKDEEPEIRKFETFVKSTDPESPSKDDNNNSYIHETPLVVNAWSSVNVRGFKRHTLKFINQYQMRSKVSKSSNYTYGARKFAPRRIINTYVNDQSDSDSQFEKVRTRRVVRESSTQVEDSQRPPRASTPTIKRVRKTVASSPSPAPINIDWESLPDFSPDISTLPSNNTRCLKVEWKGQPMSLASDPLVSKLHPAEVTLASILRLPCNLYLDSKRRLFMEKVSRLKKGLPFRRTDAQKSCRIDVNKASRLFAAFEKIGWLKDDKFYKHL